MIYQPIGFKFYISNRIKSIVNVFIFYLLLQTLLGLSFPKFSYSQPFYDAADTVGLNLDGNKDGGHAWADFNNDGCLDLIANTSDNTNRTRLYLSNCDNNPDNISFTDVTATYAAGLLAETLDRSLVWGDFNNDGYIDFARNDNAEIEVYINRGPDDATQPYSFGDAALNPNFTISAGGGADVTIGGVNAEGMLWADSNGDGFLDLVFDNHGNGTEVLTKDLDGADPCTDGFDTYQDGNLIGLDNGNSTGDYMALGDINNDGWPDFIVRKEDNDEDLYMNNGDGTYTLNTEITNANANNGNKGGVAFCDFDNDGDLDFIWTDNDGNNIWENDGDPEAIAGDPDVDDNGNGVAYDDIEFTLRDEATVFGGSINRNIDGCACGDIDNDGDIDIVFTGDNARFLFFNSGDPDIAAVGKFTLYTGTGVTSGNDGESISMVDFDNDGDLDIYSNNDNENELWKNYLNNDNYLKVRVVMQNQRSTAISGRDLIGATATLAKTSDDSTVGGIQMINGGRGHGSQDPMIMHFGLPEGPDTTYTVTVYFPNINSNRDTVIYTIVPSSLDNQTLVAQRSGQDLGMTIDCNNELVFLPVELSKFDAELEKRNIRITWQTASEKNTSHFELEKSNDGKAFIKIAKISASGNSDKILTYRFTDWEVSSIDNYYRLKIIDYDGYTEYSQVIYIKMNIVIHKLDINVFPNPSDGELFLMCNTNSESIRVDIYEQSGKLVFKDAFRVENFRRIKLTDTLPSGLYIIKVNDGLESKSIKATIK